MNNSTPLFDYRKDQFDDRYSSGIYLVILLYPFVIFYLLFRNGSLDLTNLPFLLMGYIAIILISLPVPFFKIKIFQNELIATNILGIKKSIPNNRITYNESYFIRGQGNQTLELIIKYKKTSFKIYKDEANDYDALINFCKTNYRKFTDNSFNYYHFFVAIVIILGILLNFGSDLNLASQEFDDQQSINQNGYIKMKGTINNYKAVGKKGHELSIEINEYPKYNFILEDFGRNREVYLQKLQSQNSIILYIAPNQYNKKITKISDLRFYDKYYRYHVIRVYNIE